MDLLFILLSFREVNPNFCSRPGEADQIGIKASILSNEGIAANIRRKRSLCIKKYFLID